MNKVFGLDSPIMQALSWIADLMILNILTVVCCIPIFTIGPALSALHYVLLKIVRKEEGYIVKPYFRAFKENFKQGVGLGLINLAIFAVIAGDIYLIAYLDTDGFFPTWLRVAIGVIGILVFLVFQWVFPLQSHFVNPVRVTMKNAVLMAIANFPRTLGMAAIWAVPVLLVYISDHLVPVDLMFGISAPSLVMAYLYSPVFKRFEPEVEEDIRADEDFFLEPTPEEVKRAEMEALAAKAASMEQLDDAVKDTSVQSDLSAAHTQTETTESSIKE